VSHQPGPGSVELEMEAKGTLLQSFAPGNSSDEKLKSQKMHRSEPRRTLNEAIYPDVQWRDNCMATRLHERGSRNKVSMNFEKGSREEREYIPKCAPREFALFVSLRTSWRYRQQRPVISRLLAGPPRVWHLGWRSLSILASHSIPRLSSI
jgi:hypothetical protein